jgi:hypothetical protein
MTPSAKIVFALLSLLTACSFVRAASGTKVTFDEQGCCRVDGKRFFPIGVWMYDISPTVLADLHEHHFNTIVGNGVKPTDLATIEQHGLMLIPPGSDDFIKAAKSSPALLAWYLNDEPEEHNTPPEQVKKEYDALRAKDSDHPIGLTHCQLSAPAKFKDACDFTMTDVYPVTAQRDWPLAAVGKYTDEPRRVHGPGWPNFTFIQTFGGPDSDGGKWAQPLPHEVRFMAFDALVHRANGILYFSYWPRSPLTWDAIAKLNREIETLLPWLIGDGDDRPASSSNAAVEIRARQVGSSWMIIVLNTSKTPQEATVKVAALGDATARRLADGQPVRWQGGSLQDSLAPFEEKVFLVGPQPAAPLRR